MATWQQLAWKSETLTPAEIEALIAEMTAELIYAATGGSVLVGTVTSGTYASTNVHDGTPWDIQEAAGTPGFDIRLTFSDVETFNRVRGIVRYEGSVSHTVEIQVYDYAEAEWEVYDTVVSSDGYTSFEIIIPDPADHVDGSGNATIRFYHTTSGNPSHNMHLDYVCLARAGIGAVSDHGLLGGLDDDDHIQYYNQARGDARYGRLGAANEWAGTQTYDDGGANFVTINSDGLTLADAGINFSTAVGTPYINYNDYLLFSMNTNPVLTLDDNGFVYSAANMGVNGPALAGDTLVINGSLTASSVGTDYNNMSAIQMRVPGGYAAANQEQFRFGYWTQGVMYMTVNLDLLDSGWNLDTTAIGGAVLGLYDNNFNYSLRLRTFPAGTNPRTGTEIFAVMSNGDAWVPVGKFGVGNAAPQKKLHVTGTILVDGDEGGYAGTVGFTDVTTGVSTGTGTIKVNGTTARNSTGWLKIYVGTTAVYIPYFQTITG